MFSAVANDWHLLGDSQYERFDLYSGVSWSANGNFRLEHQHISSARNGGPIAITRNERLTSKQSKVEKEENKLTILSCSGKVLGEVSWENKRVFEGKLIAMGWTSHDFLITARELGVIEVRNVIGRLLKTIRINSNTAEPIVINGPNMLTHGKVWSDGILTVTLDLKVTSIVGVNGSISLYKEEAKMISFASNQLRNRRPQARVTAFDVVEPECSASGLLEAVIGLADGEVWILSEQSASQCVLPETVASHPVCLNIAPGGHFVLYFSAGGVLSVLKDELSVQIMEFDTSTLDPPKQVEWCGQDCVLIHWPGAGILMVGPSGDWTRLHYASSNPLVLIPEVDCCRIMTADKMELLQRVPESTEAISRIGSTEPAAMLFDAMEAFDEGDPKADDHIRAMARGDDPYALPPTPTGVSAAAPKTSNPFTADGGTDEEAEATGGTLVQAVSTCIAAAAAQFDVDKQKALLRAAAYGKGFIKDYDSDEFVSCCRKLRVLNSMRSREVGIPMTLYQFDAVGIDSVLERLVGRRLHLFASKVCKQLKLSPDVVLSSWATEYLLMDTAVQRTDEELKSKIKDRYSMEGVYSLQSIARAAARIGRKRLAIMLLESEPFMRDQVESLLDIGEEELALKSAIHSGDFDLITLAVIRLEEKISAANVFLASHAEDPRKQPTLLDTTSSYPESLRVLKAYLGSREGTEKRPNLIDICQQRNQAFDVGSILLEAAYKHSRLDDRLSGLREAEKAFAASRDLSFQQASTREEAELLDAQRALATKFGKPIGTFVGLSLSETIERGIAMGAEGSLADYSMKEALAADVLKLAKKFRVSEKHLWYIRVRALASTKQWTDLRSLSIERRNPIGLKPFAEAVLQFGGSTAEADYYTDRANQR